jgi:hypothetical protein
MRNGRAKEVLDEMLNAAGLTMQDVRVEMVYQRFDQEHRKLMASDPVTEPEQPPADEPVHISAADCWCRPVEDEPGVWVHRPVWSARIQRILSHA